MRAPERRIFNIDVGNIPPNEVDQYMQAVVNKMKKIPYIDESTGEYNLKFNMENILEDYYFPKRGDSAASSVETLAGLTYDAIDDIEYLRKRMFTALKVPKPFLNDDADIEGKATLAAMDMRFARTIERIQKIVLSELTKIAIVHLTANGYTDADLVNFELKLHNPSIVYKQERIQLLTEQVSLARDMKDLKLFGDDTIMRKVFDLSEDEIKQEQIDVIKTLKQDFRKQQIEDEGNDPAKTGKSYGTPHDLAALHTSKPGNSDYIEKSNDYTQDEEWMDNVGRPKESGTYGKHKSNLTRDPLGRKELGAPKPDSSPLKHKYRGNSPIHIESIVKNIRNEKVKPKSIITESLTEEISQDPDAGTMLDENNILDT
jgi:hypothetical protein